MTEHSSNLRAAIADLKRRRAEINAAITSMETILASVYGGEAVSETVETPLDRAAQLGGAKIVRGLDELVFTHGHVPMSRAEKVRKAFEDQPEAIWTTVKLADEIGEAADGMTLKAISAILSRLYSDDQIVRVGRGAYCAATTNVPDSLLDQPRAQTLPDSDMPFGADETPGERGVSTS